MISGTRVKVIKVKQEKMMNLWGGYDDVTSLLQQIGVIKRVYDSGEYENYGIEFDDYMAQLTRERTGIVFYKDDLEVIE